MFLIHDAIIKQIKLLERAGCLRPKLHLIRGDVNMLTEEQEARRPYEDPAVAPHSGCSRSSTYPFGPIRSAARSETQSTSYWVSRRFVTTTSPYPRALIFSIMANENQMERYPRVLVSNSKCVHRSRIPIPKGFVYHHIQSSSSLLLRLMCPHQFLLRSVMLTLGFRLTALNSKRLRSLRSMNA